MISFVQEIRRKLCSRLSARLRAGVFAAGTLLMMTTSAPTQAADEAASDAWRFEANPYVWNPVIGGATGAGDFSLGFGDILNSLNWLTMGQLTASNNKFSVSADIINMKLNVGGGQKIPLPLRPGSPFAGRVTINTNSKAVLKSWIVSPTVGYRLVDKEQASLQVLAGARYLSLDVTSTVSAAGSGPLGLARAVQLSATSDSWDGIVGASGRVFLSDSKHLYFDYYGDIGTGDSDLTWQVQGTIGYRINDSWDVRAGYRYLRWDFDSSSTLTKLHVGGPQFGASYRF